MKIAMFTNTYSPAVGGIERSIEIFAGQMRALGHRVIIVAPEYEGADESTAEVYRVPAIKNIVGSPYSIKIAVPGSMVRKLTEFEPDIIHSHQPFLLGDSALRLARSFGVPIVYTNHTFMERYLYWFSVDWQILRDVAERLPTAYANLVDQVITPTRSVAEVLIERGTKTDISIIPTGIDAEFYASGDREAFRTRWQIDPGQFVLGHLGRLSKAKNLDFLMRVALAFVRQHANARILLVGDGDFTDTIKKYFTEAGAKEYLIYAGLLHGREVADAFAAMDAFLFTSLSDTQGLVLSEAMAAGNPVFALRAPGPQDMIQHGATGWLFNIDTSPENFSLKMNEVVEDATLFAKLQNNVRQAARELSVLNCTEKMLAVYREVITRKGYRQTPLSTWEKLIGRLEVEFDLMQEKLECLR